MLPKRLIVRLALLPIVISACSGASLSNERIAGEGTLPEETSSGATEREQRNEERGTPPSNESGGDPGAPAVDTKELDAFVEGQLEATPAIPGISLALVKGGKVVAARAYGLADRERNAPMKTDTILEVASISKTFTGVALMQLVAEGKVSLGADISTYLGRTIKNPRFAAPITTKMLLTHTSSILGNDQALDSLFQPDADSPMPLSELSAQFLVQGGRYYTTQTYSTSAPGSQWAYCNVCLGVVGHLVERVAGTSLSAHTKEKIFTPLGMTSTSWLLADTDRARLVTPYSVDPRTGQAERVPHFGLPDWPAGSLKTTALDLARFAAELSSDGTKILPKTELDEMLKVHFAAGTRNPDQGLTFMKDKVAGREVWGHNGALPGIASVYSFVRSQGLGVVVLANTDVEVADPALRAIETKSYEVLSR